MSVSLAQLDYSARTAKRVAWEAWEFTIEGPHLVRVTNASYGYLKDDHAYTVGIEERDGQLIPAECECPADVHGEEDCKHKVALAACGRTVVMQAAVDSQTAGESELPQEPATAADKLTTDGGTTTSGESPPLDAIEREECNCSPRIDFPCFDCYREGRKELPE